MLADEESLYTYLDIHFLIKKKNPAASNQSFFFVAPQWWNELPHCTLSSLSPDI